MARKLISFLMAFVVTLFSVSSAGAANFTPPLPPLGVLATTSSNTLTADCPSVINVTTTSSSNATQTLPLSTLCPGKLITVNFVATTSTGTVPLALQGSDAFRNLPSPTLTLVGQSYMVVSDGNGYWVPVSGFNQSSAQLTTLDAVHDWVVSGLLGTVPGSSLSMTIPAGIAYVNGTRISPSASTNTYTASKDTYVDIDSTGTFHYSAVSNGASQPSLTTGYLRLEKVTTSASYITGVTPLALSIPILKGSQGYRSYWNGANKITSATTFAVGNTYQLDLANATSSFDGTLPDATLSATGVNTVHGIINIEVISQTYSTKCARMRVVTTNSQTVGNKASGSLIIFVKGEHWQFESDGSNWQITRKPPITVAHLPNARPLSGQRPVEFGNGYYQYDSITIEDSTGKFWGWGNLGQYLPLMGYPGTPNAVVPCSAIAWDPVNPPAPGTYPVDWAMTNMDMFVVMSDGTAYAGGYNVGGTCGLGNTTPVHYLAKITYFSTNSITVKNVYCGGTQGYDMAFWVDSNNNVYAAGYNNNGQLGYGNTTNQSTPVKVINTTAISDIQTSTSAGNGITLVLTSAGSIKSAGYNAAGELGVGNTSNQSSFQSVSITGSPTIKQIRIGAVYTGGDYSNSACIDSAGNLYITGSNYSGEIGTGGSYPGTNVSVFTKNTTLGATVADFKFGSVGQNHCTAVDTSGHLWSWGCNAQYQCFSSSAAYYLTPVKQYNNSATVLNFDTWGGGVNYSTGYGVTFVYGNDRTLRFAGSTLQLTNCSQADSSYSSGVANIIPLPSTITSGQENIIDLWSYNSNDSSDYGSLWILTDTGRLFAAGNQNSDWVCSAGLYTNFTIAPLTLQNLPINATP